jgi:hypothetical protein
MSRIEDLTSRLFEAQRKASSVSHSVKAHSDISSSTEVIAAGTRVGATIFNNLGGDVFLKLGGGTVSSSSFSLKIAAGNLYELPYRFEGSVTAITAASSGNLQITTLK